MSAKTKKQKMAKKKHVSSSLLSRYPKYFLSLGLLLVIISVCLLSVGYVSHAKIGLAMLSLFFGMSLVVFANFSLSKH